MARFFGSVEAVGSVFVEPDHNTRLKAAALKKPAFVTKSRAMLTVLNKVDRLSEKNTNILVSGEDGTGRELIARTLHLSSPYRTRSARPVAPATTVRRHFR